MHGDDCVVFIDVGLNNGTNKKERNKERKVKRKEWIIRVGYASGDDLSTPSNLPLHLIPTAFLGHFNGVVPEKAILREFSGRVWLVERTDNDQLQAQMQETEPFQQLVTPSSITPWVCPQPGKEVDQEPPSSISPGGILLADCNSPVSCGAPCTELTQGSEDNMIPEDFDNFVDSLDDMLAQPLPEALLSPSATDNYQASEDEIAEARIKLSSLLAMDFHLLVSSKDLKELALLSSKLQKDPSLDADQLSKLKLIEEIPVTDLTSSMDKATSLRNEYNASKEDIAMLQVDINSSLSTLEEIDDQIAKLQSRRAELSTALKIKRRK
ncbi:hypothetical protein CK203_023895 [Vitis vinifera]|uniref:Uncharacterized protein n=1 Tax=Vitis vinifera TaxID=29760 RepID=A0A438JAB0_VITVI|nr:hypothetical protein CK203_023895 [Vitis vinifera]